jgi:hypothetical protein
MLQQSSRSSNYDRVRGCVQSLGLQISSPSNHEPAVQFVMSSNKLEHFERLHRKLARRRNYNCTNTYFFVWCLRTQRQSLLFSPFSRVHCSRYSRSTKGIRNANVFPLPVFAVPITLRPVKAFLCSQNKEILLFSVYLRDGCTLNGRHLVKLGLFEPGFACFADRKLIKR